MLKPAKKKKKRARPPGSKHGSWRHPDDRRIVLPRKVVAAVAVMQMGVTDYKAIAAAVGLEPEQVREIDAASDPAVRLLAVAGIPMGHYFNLQKTIRCPSCNAWIRIAPCVVCTNEAHDATPAQAD